MYKDRNSWNCMKEILLFQRPELYVVFVGFEYTFEYTPERGVVESPFYGLSGACYRFEPLIAYRKSPYLGAFSYMTL